MPTAVNLADLIRACERLRPDDEESVRRIASIVGFDPLELAAPTVVELEQSQIVRSSMPELEEDPRSVLPEQMVIPEPEPVMPSAVLDSSLEPAAAAALETPQWMVDVQPLPQDDMPSLGLQSPEPLFRPQWVRGVLFSTLSREVEEGYVDVGRLIDAVARVRGLEEIPRLPVPTLRWGLQLLIDEGIPMPHFRFDQRNLLRELKQTVGESNFTAFTFKGCPTRGVRPLANRKKVFAYAPPAPGTPVLLLSNLGIGEPENMMDVAGVEEWLAFARLVRREGCRPVAYVPYRPSRWPDALRREMDIHYWGDLQGAATADTPSWPEVDGTDEEIIEAAKELAGLNPQAFKLAMLLSLASRIEISLIRATRLELIADADAGAESDLVYSRLVESQTTRTISFWSEATHYLRRTLLATDPGCLPAMWEFLSRFREKTQASWAIRFAEEINYRSLLNTPDEQEKVEGMLRRALKTLVEQSEDEQGMALWAVQAVEEMPETAGQLGAAQDLQLAAQLRLSARNLPTDALDGELADKQWMVPLDEDTLPKIEAGVRLLDNGVAISEPPHEAAHILMVPGTQPRIVELLWQENGQQRRERISWSRSEAPQPQSVGPGPVTLQLISGERYTLSPVGEEESEPAQEGQKIGPFDAGRSREDTLQGDKIGGGSRLEGERIIQVDPGSVAAPKPTVSFADCEIRIFEEGTDGYPVELTLNNEQQFERGFLDPEIPLWMPGEAPAEYGEKLFDWLFADDNVRRAWETIRGQNSYCRIRLRISAEEPALHAVPWEQLRQPSFEHADLAADDTTPFSRYLVGRWQPGGYVLKRPIRILIAMANPENLEQYDLEPLDLDFEWKILLEATAGLDVELARLAQPCTLSALEDELNHGYHILHLISHAAARGRNEARLYLADENNQVKLVSESDFSAMMSRRLSDTDDQREDKLRLVFLAGCQTAARSSADAYRELAPALVNAGIPAVVAMQDLLPMKTARQFVSVFYQRLLQHGLVDLAGNEARSSVITADLSGAVMPVLYSRLRDGRLLGQRGRINVEGGRITSGYADSFWPLLMEKIDSQLCIPFLGPGATEGLLPRRSSIANSLADRFNYPLPDRSDLAKVAGYVALIDTKTLRRDYISYMNSGLVNYLGLQLSKEERRRLRRASFSETSELLGWSEKVLQVTENEIHHLLADLPFPLYMTTNFDNFMNLALLSEGKKSRRLGPRWGDSHEYQTWLLDPEPAEESPAVFHLNGFDGDPEQLRHLVLSEEDYIAHITRLSRDLDTILPVDVLSTLANSSYIFLGYQWGEWEFRVILEGLLKSLSRASVSREFHVAVLMDDANTEEIEQYLLRSLAQYNIDIYWGTTKQFVTELSDHWQHYLEEDDDW